MIPRDSAVPSIDVDPQQLLEESSTLVSRAHTLQDEVSKIRDTWSTLPDVFDIEGTEAIYTKLDPTETVMNDYVSSLESAAGALDTFAGIVTVLKQQRTDLLADLGGARMEEQIAEESDEDESGTVRVYDEDKLRNRIDGLRRSFEQAEDDCAATIRGISGGTGEGMRQAAPSTSFANYWPSQASAFDARMRDGALRTMDYLTTLSEKDAKHWVEDHPDFADALVVAPPAAAVVAAWWQKMGTGQVNEDGLTVDSDAQKHLIAVIPAVIGNLGGVDYSSRSKANVDSHTAELTRLRDLDRQMLGLHTREKVGERTKLLEENGFPGGSIADFREALNAEESIESALGMGADKTFNEGSTDDVPLNLVHYAPGQPPLAAISAGHMDTASRVTVNVPGMNTTVVDSMESWTGGALNLYRGQKASLQLQPGNPSTAVVAWIGYETPTETDVLLSDKAEVGSVKLESFLESVTATTGRNPGEDLGVLAHSYGAVTSTLTLSRTPVDSLTMVAPAGVDSSVSVVGDLKVDPKDVWVTEANGDPVANIGRGSLEIGPFGVGALPSEHPYDPRQPEYGANSFSSEGLWNANDPLRRTDEHGVVPRVEDLLAEDEPKNSYGYLDRGTTSLHWAALNTLGRGDEIEEAPPRPVIRLDVLHPLLYPDQYE
jgi:hypothetical protein